MKRSVRLLLSVSLIILLTNVFVPVRFVLGMVVGRKNSIFESRYYSTRHNYFSASDEGMIVKGATVEQRFSRYKACHPSSPDTVLYRRFRLQPWQFWDWLNYFYQPKWRLPYLDSSQVPYPPVNPPESICP